MFWDFGGFSPHVRGEVEKSLGFGKEKLMPMDQFGTEITAGYICFLC